MTIAIHESALIRHFNTRKETLRAWEEKVGCKFSPFRGFKMPDSRLYVEHPEFLDSIVDLVLTNERHIFIRGPVGSGKSTLMLLALRDLPTLADRRGNKFITGYVGMTGLYEKQMAAAIADSLRIKYRRSWESSQIIEAVAQECLRRYIEEKSRTALFIEDVADNQEAAFHKLRYLADLPSEEMIDSYEGTLDEPIITLIMSGTAEYWNAMLNFLPQIADRTEPLDVPPLDDHKALEFIGRRLAYARGEIDKFDPDNFDIYPFTQDAIIILNQAARGNPRDIRMLARGCQQVAAENFKRFSEPVISPEIAQLVAEAYVTILKEVR
ncbi:MAG: ATP-binding protein [Candidatus Thorarchaeota archaeon]|nr:ATP-binding protein [Candidatus Thorarchaeota archaeon]